MKFPIILPIYRFSEYELSYIYKVINLLFILCDSLYSNTDAKHTGMKEVCPRAHCTDSVLLLYKSFKLYVF